MSGIPAALDKLGIDYEIRGNEAAACCPAHDDMHPSWSINLDTGMHHCFACGFGGGVATLIRQVTGKSWGDARQWQKQQRARSAWRPAHRPQPAADSMWKYTEAALHMLDDAPAERLSARRLTLDSARAYGIKWNTQKESWVLPIRDGTGKLMGWQEKSEHVFRNKPRTVRKSETLFSPGAAAHGSGSILVESPLDASRLLAAGFAGGRGSFGVSVSDQQLAALWNIDGPVIFALDNDPAGVRETHRLLRLGLDTRRVRMLNYSQVTVKDPGEMTDQEISWGLENALARREWLAQVWYPFEYART